MINHLVVNPDLYALTFVTDDNLKFEVIKANIKSVPKSKMKITFINGRNALIVNKEFYEYVIDEGMNFLIQNNLEENIYWNNKNNLEMPCGYYQVATATPFDDDNDKYLTEMMVFFSEIYEKTQLRYWYKYDYLSKTYCICLEGANHEELVLKFNEFLLKNEICPFRKIEVTSRYGELGQINYPILRKRK